MTRAAAPAATTPTPCTVALRTAGAMLVELPITPAPDPVLWVAIIRPAACAPGGWARQLWWRTVDGAGWSIPHACIFGAVVEFGADPHPRRHRDRHPHRWYGIAVAHDHDWLVVHGPYAHPADAERQATEWLASARAYAVALHDPSAEAPEPAHRPTATRRMS
jgi:hypothetical protein